jgi:uncharacterized protein
MKNTFIKPLIACSFLTFFALSNSYAKDIDCKKTPSPTEKLICNQADTTGLYQKLNELYQEQTKGSDQAKTITAMHQQWHKQKLQTCQNLVCLNDQIQTQITDLQGLEKKSPLISQWSGQYQRSSSVNKNSPPAQINLLVLQDKKMALSGQAQWQADAKSAVNIGQIKGIGTVQNPNAFLVTINANCLVQVKWLKANQIELIEEKLSNGQASVCGGQNVKFNGIYKRT